MKNRTHKVFFPLSVGFERKENNARAKIAIFRERHFFVQEEAFLCIFLLQVD